MTAHDQKVLEEAQALEKNGWTVWADHLEGYNQPEPIERLIPDIYATKTGVLHQGRTDFLIVEVDTGDSDQKHMLHQKLTFKRHAIDHNGSFDHIFEYSGTWHRDGVVFGGLAKND